MINEQELNNLITEQGVDNVAKGIVESLKKGDTSPSDYSIKDMFETFVPNGRELLRSIGSGKKALYENGLATSVSPDNFSNINYQIFYNAIQDPYKYADLSLPDEFGVVMSNNLGVNEKFPLISNLGDLNQVVPPGEEIPAVGVNEDWLNTPVQQKRGERVPVLYESVAADKTGTLLMQCGEVADSLRLNRAKEAAATIANAGGSANRTAYNRKGIAYATYGSWDGHSNDITSNPLVDHTSIAKAYCNGADGLASMVDPNTLEPMADTDDLVLLVPPSLKFKAMNILRSVQFQSGTLSTSNNRVVTDGETVVPFRIVVSKYLRAANIAAGVDGETWYLGNFKKAFKWVRNLDIQAEMADMLSGMMFTHHIIWQVRVLKLETSSIWQPRMIVRNQP